MDLVVPLAVEFVAFDDAFGKGIVGSFDALVVGLVVEPGMNFQSGNGLCVADARYNDFVRLQGRPSPISCDVTEHSVLDLVPFARPAWVVANFNDPSRLIGQTLKLQLPKPTSRTITATAVGGDQQAFGSEVSLSPQLLPPQTNCCIIARLGRNHPVSCGKHRWLLVISGLAASWTKPTG